MAQGAVQLCDPGSVLAISTARESIEQYLKNTLEEIAQLQESEQFLDNIEEIQTRSKDFETWKVQREQLSAVETCAKSCTCDEGATLVIQEYNTLAHQAGESSGLIAVPLPQSGFQLSLIAIIAAVLVFGVYRLVRRRT